MAKILIPRSDSISVKTIEPSDFEEFFQDIIHDYLSTGFTLTSGTGLSVNIAIGKARLKGLFVHNDSASSKGSLTANDVNYIYITLTRDSNSEAESWDFTSNLTGTTPTDSLFIGTATTNGSSVTATSNNNVVDYTNFTSTWLFGNAEDGDVTISTNTTLTEPKYYNELTINSGVTVSGASPIVIFAKKSVTITGNITVNNSPTLAAGTGGINSAGATSGTLGVSGYINDGATAAAGGDGGDGGGSAGGNGSSGGISNTALKIPNLDYIPKSVINIISKPNLIGSGGSGGSGGGRGGSGWDGSPAPAGGDGGNGGIGGGNGGALVIISPIITFTGTINCDGVDGVAGTAGTDGGDNDGIAGAGGSGGGGGGSGGSAGNGGYVFFGYEILNDTGTTTVAGGTGGAAGAGGGGGSADSGVDGAGGGTGGAGGNGSTGTIIKMNIHKQ